MDDLKESGIKFPDDYKDQLNEVLQDSQMSLDTSKIIETTE